MSTRLLKSLFALAAVTLIGGCIAGDFANENSNGGQSDSECKEACDGDTPVCDEGEGECVECLDADEDCEGEEFCSDEGACVECLESEDCDDGACSDDGECVECAEDADCPEAGASACSEENQCIGCEESDQCAHLDEEGTPACDADAAVCVECTVDDESACDGNSCDPESNTCTDTETDSLDTCESCVADSECSGDAHCVPLEFDGDELDDGYCLSVKDGECPKPYGVVLDDKTSLSGAEGEEYCGINEDKTTCEAVLDYFEDDTTCSENEDCGNSEYDNDGECVGTSCTYHCDDSSECAEECVGINDTKVCGSNS